MLLTTSEKLARATMAEVERLLKILPTADAAGKAPTVAPAVYYGAAILGALFVLVVGKWFSARRQAQVMTS